MPSQDLCLYYPMSFRTQLTCHLPQGALHLVSPQCALPSLLATGKPVARSCLLLWDKSEGKEVLGRQGKASALSFLPRRQSL